MGIFDFFGRAKRSGTDPQADARARAGVLVDEGNALCDEGRMREAMERYAQALALAPGLPRAHLNIGNAVLAAGDVHAAVAAYSAALVENPGYAAAHYNLGNARTRQDDAQAALASYARAVELEPGFVDAWVALGNTQDDLHLYHEAAASYEQALRLHPGYAQVHANLGNVLRQLGSIERAAQCYKHALELDPALAQAHVGLGSLAWERSDWLQALASFRQAAARDDSGAALAQAYHSANQLCDWSQREADELALVRTVAGGGGGVPPFFLLGLEPPGGDPALLLLHAARQFAAAAFGSVLATARPGRAVRPSPDRLHIGYLSADFHEHATMQLLRGVLAGHDRSKFLVTAYSYGGVEDGTTSQVRQACEAFRDLSALADPQAAQLIAADQVDILVDLKGFTRHTRLGISARRPAPVVVSWLGYPGTLGAPGLADYLVGDAIVTPPQDGALFSETLALMPHCYQPNDSQRPIGRRPTRGEAGLAENAFVFCSFNQNYKFNPATFDVWCRLLCDVPDSVLWLLPSSATAVANLQREAQARGVDADRLVFCPMLPPADHLARLGLADLALDTSPYNSHTTGSDALWAGVPLVTRIGRTFAGRVAASLLHAAALPELVTQDWDEYFALAKSLALDRSRLSALRGRLSETRSQLALFDTARFTRDLERLYGRMHAQAVRGVRNTIVLQDAD